MTQHADRRLEKRFDPLLTEKVVFAVGPQHPSLPAPVALNVQADGELIERVYPEVGYMHRGVEHLCQTRPLAQCAPLLSRCDWLSGHFADYIYSNAIEQLYNVEAPERAQWLRTLVLELNRISSHLFWWGQLGLEAGAITPVFWAMRERELLLDLFYELTGSRWHHHWIIPGGVNGEPPLGWYGRVSSALRQVAEAVEHYERFYSDNAIWINRSELIGTLDADFALISGASGPVLRASGVAHDLRRDQPYLKYAEVEFDIPSGEHGDVLDRYRVRMEEIRQSISIAGHCLEELASVGDDAQLRDGEIPEINNETELPKGDVYAAVEGPRGEMGLTLVTNGGAVPERVHLRAPSLYHLFLLDELCRGYLLADLFVIFGSLDIMIGEVDR